MDLDDLFEEAMAWQKKCARCANLVRSDDDSVWHCGIYRVGRNRLYAITARHEGRCGENAKDFKTMPNTGNERRVSVRSIG